MAVCTAIQYIVLNSDKVYNNVNTFKLNEINKYILSKSYSVWRRAIYYDPQLSEIVL